METDRARDFLALGMRRITLIGTFLLLVAALVVLWQHRFERSPEFPTYHLADLRAVAQPSLGAVWTGPTERPTLKLQVDSEHPRVVARLALPNMTAVNLLHLRFQIAAKNLTPGKEIWDDGRALIEWHPEGGASVWENDPFGSARFSHGGGITERVMRPERGPAIPALRFENLGTSGDFEISLLEATVLQERLLWKVGRWFLLAGWLAWAIAWIGIRGKTGQIRTVLAAAVWLVMGVCAVVPGPWKGVQALATPFQLGQEITRAPATSPTDLKTMIPNSPLGAPVQLKSVGKIPNKGDWILRVKHFLPDARPLLHIALLFFPTGLMAYLVGRKSATSLAIILALATETAEFAFGFGFGSDDVLDLVFDAVGIALALVALVYLKRLTPPRIAHWLASGQG